jgi:hypothetical protein
MNTEMFNIKTDEAKIEMFAVRISDNEYKMEMLPRSNKGTKSSL